MANFGLLIPTRLSSSLNSIKAKIYDLESLKRSQLLIKPTRFEIIVGTPSFNDPTLTEKSVNRLQDTLKMVEELAGSDGVVLYRAESAKIAASHLKEKAA